jgi:hypothetical protein
MIVIISSKVLTHLEVLKAVCELETPRIIRKVLWELKQLPIFRNHEGLDKILHTKIDEIL